MSVSYRIPTNMTAAKKLNITGIIQQYGQKLLGFIRSRIGNEADAQDILQDVFQQLVGNVQPIEQVSGWLYRVARNKIIDKQRKQKPLSFSDVLPEEELTEFQWDDWLLETDDNPETTYLRNLFWEQLQTALDELPPEQKDVFVWTELEGIPFKVIAAQTGEKVNTLLARKRYAVLHLRERLQVLYNELLNA
jgi:RNA polymerase sigma factor (sigma-70 family)